MGLGDTLGALPVANGGTGSNNAADALANLGVLDAVYPVGSIYMSTANIDPNVLFGGTWQAIQGRFLLSSGGGYSLGATGGSSTHSLTVDELPSHSHNFKFHISSSWSVGTQYPHFDNFDNSDLSKTSNISASSAVAAAGGGQPHNNMPPYLVVNVWKRTA